MSDRLFVGVEVPQETGAQILRYAGEAAEGRLPGRVVPAENLHLTTRFIGAAGAPETQRLRQALSAAAFGPPFELEFTRAGAFPHARRARVLWLGVGAGADRLTAVARACEEAARRAGFPAEMRSFSPHLTLSRLRNPADLTALVERSCVSGIRMAVSGVVLFLSRPGATHARYEVLDRYPLAVG